MNLYFRGLTIEEALHIIEGEDVDVEDIFIEPPDTALFSDKDSAGEDEGGLTDNLTGWQISAQAELFVSRNASCDHEHLLDDSNNLNNESPPVKKNLRKDCGIQGLGPRMT